MKLLAKQIMSFYFAKIPVKGFSKRIAAKIQFNITYLMVICSIYTIYIMYDITYINFNFIIQNKSTSSTSLTSVSISSSRTTSCTLRPPHNFPHHVEHLHKQILYVHVKMIKYIYTSSARTRRDRSCLRDILYDLSHL